MDDAQPRQRRDAARDVPSGHDSWAEIPKTTGRSGAQPTSPASSTTRVRGQRLLVTGDEPERLEVLAAELRGLGAEAVVGKEGDAGYEQALALLPDAVVSGLVAPGEQGFALVDRLRVHPVLRWTPVLMLRLFEEGEGGARLRLDRVLDRLEEVFGPVRVLEERIAAGRPLSERLELTGPTALLRQLVDTGLRGMLTVNDAWSVFEIGFENGGLHSVLRRGVDGGHDVGDTAFTELLLCDAGRWSFRPLERIETPSDIDPDLEAALGRACRRVEAVFGEGRRDADTLAVRLRLRADALQAVSATMNATGRQVAGAIAKGLRPAEVKVLLASLGDLAEVDRALNVLFRCGAVVYDDGAKGAPSAARAPGESTAAALLAATADPETVAPRAAGEKPARKPPHPSGAYSMSGVAPERIPTAQLKGLNLPRSESFDSTTPIGAAPRSSLPGERKPDFTPNEPAAQSGDGRPAKRLGRAPRPVRRLVHDSLAPSPTERDRKGPSPTWIAIALALLLAGILVAALVYIGGGGPGSPPSGSALTAPGRAR